MSAGKKETTSRGWGPKAPNLRQLPVVCGNSVEHHVPGRHGRGSDAIALEMRPRALWRWPSR